MKLVLSIIAAVVAAAALSGTASAAPRIWIDHVASPTGEWNADGQSTGHVNLRGISKWTNAQCESTPWYANDPYPEARYGEDADPNGPWNNWSFKNDDVPGEWVGNYESFQFNALDRITASCDLTRTVYLGKRPYRRSIDAYRDPEATVSRRGCSIYSYSQSELTIDCRHSHSSGSATWMFGRHRSDRGGYYGINFDPSQSTMGAHWISERITATRAFVTETVSPGTMITVTDVHLTDVSRLFWRKAYRHDRKTLTASWPS